MTRAEFIRKFKGTVVGASESTRLFPSVFMAQAILESGNGDSELARKYNNYFGIKAGSSWDGDTVDITTNEYLGGFPIVKLDKFRVYDNPEESFYDRARLLTENNLYKSALMAETPEMQAKALQDAGYATDPAYSAKLISIINEENLKALDNMKITVKQISIISAVLTLIVALLTIYRYIKTT